MRIAIGKKEFDRKGDLLCGRISKTFGRDWHNVLCGVWD